MSHFWHIPNDPLFLHGCRMNGGGGDGTNATQVITFIAADPVVFGSLQFSVLGYCFLEPKPMIENSSSGSKQLWLHVDLGFASSFLKASGLVGRKKQKDVSVLGFSEGYIIPQKVVSPPIILFLPISHAHPQSVCALSQKKRRISLVIFAAISTLSKVVVERIYFYLLIHTMLCLKS